MSSKAETADLEQRREGQEGTAARCQSSTERQQRSADSLAIHPPTLQNLHWLGPHSHRVLRRFFLSARTRETPRAFDSPRLGAFLEPSPTQIRGGEEKLQQAREARRTKLRRKQSKSGAARGQRAAAGESNSTRRRQARSESKTEGSSTLSPWDSTSAAPSLASSSTSAETPPTLA